MNTQKLTKPTPATKAAAQLTKVQTKIFYLSIWKIQPFFSDFS